MVHACRAAMQSLKKTGTDFVSAQGMDPKAFFKVMGKQQFMILVVSENQPDFERAGPGHRNGRKGRRFCILSGIICVADRQLYDMEYGYPKNMYIDHEVIDVYACDEAINQITLRHRR